MVWFGGQISGTFDFIYLFVNLREGRMESRMLAAQSENERETESMGRSDGRKGGNKLTRVFHVNGATRKLRSVAKGGWVSPCSRHRLMYASLGDICVDNVNPIVSLYRAFLVFFVNSFSFLRFFSFPLFSVPSKSLRLNAFRERLNVFTRHTSF